MDPTTPAPAEQARLDALHECRSPDPAAGQLCSDLVQLAATVCDAPMAMLALIEEDRLRQLAVVGPLPQELPRRGSPCELALERGDVVVVQDLRAEAAFCEHALAVAGHGARAYVGVPVVSREGFVLGVLAALDGEARTFSAAQLDALAALGRQAGLHLDTARRERARAAAAANAARTRERLEHIVAASCDGVWDLDVELRAVDVSPLMFAMLGLPKTSGQVPLLALWPMLHRDDGRGLLWRVARSLRRSDPVEVEFRCRHVDGSWRWLRARAVPVFAAGERRARRVVGTLTDIDHERRARAHLQRVSRLLAESQALARCGGWELDVATDQLFWTDETYRIHEVSPADYRPTIDSAIDFYVPEARDRIRAAVEQAVTTGRGYSLELELVTARGRHIWVRATGGAVFVDGRIARIMGALQDITRQRRTDEELRSARDAAEAASEAKSAFLAAMSHEIRTPMHTVLGYAEMLRDSQLAPQQLEYVDVVMSSGNALLRLIDDILDFSKAEAGKLQLERLPFDPRASVDEVVRMMQPQAAKKGLTIRVDDERRELTVRADPQRTRQVLINLLGNAVKFTARGEIVVAIRCVGCEVRIEVRDEGIGIARDQLPNLFQNFVQVDASPTRRFEGAGLGLAISRQLVEGMHGSIGVDSEPAKGSTFWFTLPLAESQVGGVDPVPTAAPAPGDGALAELGDAVGRRVLVVEDNRLNLRLAVRVLERFGFDVDTATEGSAAVEKARDERYDLVLMDCLMPEVDGFEATRRIRAAERGTGAHVPIIALTANALPEDRDACLAAGMDDFVSKPFTRAALRDAVTRWLRPGARRR